MPAGTTRRSRSSSQKRSLAPAVPTGVQENWISPWVTFAGTAAEIAETTCPAAAAPAGQETGVAPGVTSAARGAKTGETPCPAAPAGPRFTEPVNLVPAG